MSQDYIKAYTEANFSFFNTGTREKKCKTPWAEFQNKKPDKSLIERWSKSLIQNWAIVCGEISNLIVFDVDTKNGGDPSGFINRGFYEVRTPSGGYHFYTLYNPLLKTSHYKKESNKNRGILKGVDIQSNGTIVFAPPTQFSRGKYTVINDSPLKPIPDDLLAQLLELLEPEKEATEYTPYVGPARPLMGRPGDIFNSLIGWNELLIPLGWKKVYTTNSGVTFWTRPGKDNGISASTNWKGYDLFFAYTTSISELTPKKGYTKFSLYAALKFDGDYATAAKSLIIENYKIANGFV